MKILVGIKGVIDPNIKVKVRPDNMDIESLHARKTIDPFSEVALEESIRLKESGVATEVVVVSVGPKECDEQIRLAIASGANRGLRVDADVNIEPLEIAKILKKIVEIEKPELILMGKQSADMDHNQTGQILATLLNYSQGTCVSKIYSVGNDHIDIQKENDDGIKYILLSLPAVLTLDLRINKPRFASLPAILRSKKAEIPLYTPEKLNMTIKKHTHLLNVKYPESRPSCVRLADAEQLVNKLKEETDYL